MNKPMPPLNALRAFEAAARHLSLTKASHELNVTAGALSHQIRGLEEMLGMKLFERRVRSIALTATGKLLYPGLQTGFMHIRDAVAGLEANSDDRVLVISTPPGFTAKWLAPRLYRFASAYPEIDVRISSSFTNANFTNDGIDLAIRNLAVKPAFDSDLEYEKLIDIMMVPVCSPRFIGEHGSLRTAQALAKVPLVHDDTLSSRVEVPTWTEWFREAGVTNANISRGLRFNSADHALDAAGEGAGVLLAHNVLAYDELRTGRLVIPVDLALHSGRSYYIVCPKKRHQPARVDAFKAWVKQEISALDWNKARAGKQ